MSRSRLNRQPILITDADSVIGRRLQLSLEANGRHVGALPAGWPNSSTPIQLPPNAIILHTTEWRDTPYADSAEAIATNVGATGRLLKAAAQANCARFIFLSSIAAYGPVDKSVVDEQAPVDTNQAWLYGRTKALAEKQITDSGLPYTIVRAGLVVGPELQDWTANLLSMIQKRSPVLWHDGGGNAPLLSIDNLIAALTLAVDGPEGIYQLVDPPISWSTYVGQLAAWTEQTPRHLRRWQALALRWIQRPGPVATELETFYSRTTRFPTTQISRGLGYRPVTTIDATMPAIERWLRKDGYLPQLGASS